MTAALVADRVHVAYGAHVAVHDVSLAVGDREFVALLGANGSGKSTLVRALLGLAPVTAGEVRLFGTPLKQFREWPRVGFVPQHLVHSDSAMPASVREVVASGRVGRTGWWRRTSPRDREACAAALDAVGLSDRARDLVRTLSGGQQQRVLIARALAGEPDVLVLDEPTAGVDRESQDALAETLRALKGSGHAMLLVTHHLGPLADLVDRAVVLDAGRVTYDGPVPEGGMAPDDEHHHRPSRDPGMWSR